jgi:hypothetical protein
MKKITLSGLLVVIFALSIIASCGGGGAPPAPTPPSTATLTLTSSGSLPVNTEIGGIDVTVTLPAGVAVKTTPSKANPSAMVTYTGVVVPSGVAAGANAIAFATLTAPGKLNIQIANPNGFGTGEFVSVTFNIASGSEVVPAEFSIGTFTAVDLNGMPISGLSGELAVVLK